MSEADMLRLQNGEAQIELARQKQRILWLEVCQRYGIDETTDKINPDGSILRITKESPDQ